MADNPYRRLRKLTTTSQKDFGEKYDLSKTTLIYIESGQYPDLSDYMIVSLGQECKHKNVDAKQVLREEYNAQDLQTAYHSWQSTERMQVAYRFRAVAPVASKKLSPMETFIKDVGGSVQNFCKMLKVPSATVGRYAAGTTKTMPAIIEKALKEVQYPYLKELVELQEAWATK